jgi:hypothetical protein
MAPSCTKITSIIWINRKLGKDFYCTVHTTIIYKEMKNAKKLKML